MIPLQKQPFVSTQNLVFNEQFYYVHRSIVYFRPPLSLLEMLINTHNFQLIMSLHSHTCVGLNSSDYFLNKSMFKLAHSFPSLLIPQLCQQHTLHHTCTHSKGGFSKLGQLPGLFCNLSIRSFPNEMSQHGKIFISK